MSQTKTQSDANKILMATYGWPEEIQKSPEPCNPMETEPEQEQGHDGIVAIYLDQHTKWITGYPLE